MQLLRQNCQFPRMRQKVETYIKKCFNCQKNKHATHVMYEEIYYQQSSITSWEEIIMNFIIKLLKFKDSIINVVYDSILVMIDRLIKYLHIVSFNETYIAKQLKFIVLNRLIRYHEISRGITSDKDKFFTFNYWRMWITSMRIKLKLSTTYYFVTND